MEDADWRSLMPYRWDLLLKGGEVIDPALGLRAPRDVAFKDGRVAAVEIDLASEDARPFGMSTKSDNS
jgi:predicted amidohydrolase